MTAQLCNGQADLSRVVWNTTTVAGALGISRQRVKAIVPYRDDAIAELSDGSLTKVARRDVLGAIAKERRRRGRELDVQEIRPGHFRVRDYSVYTCTDGVRCECMDYRNLRSAIPETPVCCKHGYAVLNVVGFATLKQYLDHVSTI